MINEIAERVIRRQVEVLDQQASEAFRQHFGFPIDEVKDDENFEHVVLEDYNIEFFRYRGHTFLLYERGEPTFIDKKDGTYTFVVCPKFTPV